MRAWLAWRYRLSDALGAGGRVANVTTPDWRRRRITQPDRRDADELRHRFSHSPHPAPSGAPGMDMSRKRQRKPDEPRGSQYARSLIEASLDPFVTISVEGKIADVNEA